MPYFNHEIKLLEAQLQTEESRTKVVIIQGKLAGFRSMIKILNDIEGFDLNAITETKEIPCKYEDKEWVCNSMDFDTVRIFKTMFDDLTDKITLFNQMGEKKIEDKKNHLFYCAEKGRDLHFVKGWYFAFNIMNEWQQAVSDRYNLLSNEKKQELPFEGDEYVEM